jgi:methyltransferase (TIGR00027 family)
MRNEPSRTAEVVCLFRAMDQRRPESERILDDPYARHFLGPLFRTTLSTIELSGPIGRLAEEYSPGLVAYILTRHRYIDDVLLSGLSRGIEQVVLMGAGYDSRAYRFASQLAGRPIFELDFPATARRKGEILAELKELPQPNLKRLEIDFREERVEDVLDRGGFERGKKTFFV